MKNLVSGTRPTGSLHLGHYFGVLQNWVKLQNSGEYNCHFFIADWHSLTTNYTDTQDLQKHTMECAKDFLACGLDPNKSLIYVQSAAPAIAQLHLILSMIVPNNWLERDPTLKDMIGEAGLNYGLLGYPVLQTADILAFKGQVVPVGKDQEAHLELSRDIVRKFNQNCKQDFFLEPQPIFTETPKVLGLDGQKMSKSKGNDLKLASSAENTTKGILQMITDPNRKKRSDPGRTENCLVPFKYYQMLAPSKMIQVKQDCESAQIGCVDCKKLLAAEINAYFAPIREKRQSLKDEDVQEILQAGNKRAKEGAQNTLQQVAEIMKLNLC